MTEFSAEVMDQLKLIGVLVTMPSPVTVRACMTCSPTTSGPTVNTLRQSDQDESSSLYWYHVTSLGAVLFSENVAYNDGLATSGVTTNDGTPVQHGRRGADGEDDDDEGMRRWWH